MMTKKLVRLAVLTAFGFLLMYFIAFPIPPFPGFLTYDPGDIPGLIATFAFGPWAGILVQLMKCTIGYLIGASRAGLIGMTANFVSGGTMVWVAGLVYRYRKTKGMAALSLVIGTIVASLVMAVADYYVFFPLWGIPTNEALPLLVSAVIPFNLVKFGISSIVTFLVYKRVKSIFALEN
ncbi:MAG TPA: ECF transporter S component [Clostridia bacterium]|jgi:riboflavin transporter FmnP|nr:ECF transporter S component [Clostridia bacterium]